MVILEFIATAVETQPGLIELFLDLSSKDDKVSAKLCSRSALVLSLGDLYYSNYSKSTALK